jgi:hypothetical protein
MKKLNHRFPLALLVGLLICFSSCSNNEELDNDIERILKRIERFNPGETSCISYGDFREDGKMTKYGLCPNPPEVYVGYHYDETGRYIGADGRGNLYYDGDLLVSWITSNDTGTGSVSFTYNGNTIEGVSAYNGVPFDSKGIYEFSDTNYSKLISITVYSDISTTPYVSNITTFEYEDDLLVRSEQRGYNENTEELEQWFVYEYAYDNRKNPYKLSLLQNAFVTSFISLFNQNDTSRNLAEQMDHNIVMQKQINYIQDYVSILEREYTYDDFGFPISYSENHNGEPIRNVTFEYY